MNPSAILHTFRRFTAPKRHPTIISTTGNLTLTEATHGGRVMHNTVSNVTYTLPLIDANNDGVEFTFVQGDAASAAGVETHVNPTSEDSINGGTSGVGYSNQSTGDALGDHLKLKADNTNSTWWVIGRSGPWTTT